MAHMCHRGGASQTSERTIWLTCVIGGGKSDLREDYMAHMCHRGGRSDLREDYMAHMCHRGGKSDLREDYMAHVCHSVEVICEMCLLSHQRPTLFSEVFYLLPFTLTLGLKVGGLLHSLLQLLSDVSDLALQLGQSCLGLTHVPLSSLQL